MARLHRANAKMASIVEMCSKLSSRNVEAQSRFTAAMDSLQSRSPEAASKLNSAADALESRDPARASAAIGKHINDARVRALQV